MSELAERTVTEDGELTEHSVTEDRLSVIKDDSPDSTLPRWPERVLLVSSSGGHLAQLARLADWWGRRERLWVTFPGQDADSLLGNEDVVNAYHPTTRNVPNAVRNLWLSARVLRSYRPQLLVSTGAGVAFPFFVMAKALGIPTVYIEVYDRIDLPTLTGRLCYPLADLFLLQWEEQRRHYPRGVLIGSLFG